MINPQLIQDWIGKAEHKKTSGGSHDMRGFSWNRSLVETDSNEGFSWNRSMGRAEPY